MACEAYFADGGFGIEEFTPPIRLSAFIAAHCRQNVSPPFSDRTSLMLTRECTMRFVIVCCLCLPVLSATLRAQDEYTPNVADASRDAELALQGFRIPEGMSGQLIAAEPLVANPVVFFVANDGKLYVCETFRQQMGVEDNRSHSDWLENDLRLETVEERLAMFKKYLGPDVQKYAQEHDRIRLLTDADGDGVYEASTVFADGFNDILDGTGAGVLEHNGEVFYTCIPRLWKLTDTDGDGSVDVQDALHHGYGVRVAFRGHDMHGLVIGPDGRLYFSIGDRGYNVITKEGTRLKRVDTGAVFRCDMDGSNLEVFAYGLRNPQELAFDDFGNLFTGDNNSDSGDQARWVYVVQGGDTGWRMYFQYLDDRGPWNRERMWYPYQSDEQTAAVQPAYIVPPVANLGDGPSGLTYYPGVGLPERYKNHFFMADFRGTAGNSGIRSFSVKPRGATWELTDSHEFLWSILATDVDFAPDGSMVVSDWVNGWVGEGKGRIYRFTDQQAAQQAQEAGSAALLKNGIATAQVTELRDLLSHPDRRVRQEAQFELVRRDAEDELLTYAMTPANALRARHAMFGSWQLGLQSPERCLKVIGALRTGIQDGSSFPVELRTLAIRIIGDLVDRHGLQVMPEEFRQQLAELLVDHLQRDNLRLAGFAAVTLGAIGRAEHAAALLRRYRDDKSQDPVVRHQIAMAVTDLASRNPGLLMTLTQSSDVTTHMPILLAMRRQRDPGIAVFLQSAESALIDEAARAINDEPIEAALSALADITTQPGLSPATLRRALNASYRLGTAKHAAQVARIAASNSTPSEIRRVAATMLKTWNDPARLDTVTGRWWPLPQREVEGLQQAVSPHLPALLAGDKRLRETAIEVAANLGISDIEPTLRQILQDEAADDSTRASAFRALATMIQNDASLIQAGMVSNVETVRVAALELLTRRNPAEAVPQLGTLLREGSIPARQRAVQLLATVKSDAALELLAKSLQKVNDGSNTPAIALDLLEAAQLTEYGPLADAARLYRTRQNEQGTATATFSECLEGGDAARGYDVFFGRSAASCRRCHKVGGNGGEVGPDLSAIAKDKDRQYLLESIVDPSAKIAKGFETLIVVTIEGKVLSGIVKSEDDKVVRLMTPEGSVLTVAQDDIEERAKGKSGMPSDLSKNLTRSEIRDLVEYLSTLKTATNAAHGEAGD
jgi:quinoprotein glucose dehydrogenase